MAGAFAWDAEPGLGLAFGVDLDAVDQAREGLLDEGGRPAGEGGFHVAGEGLQFVAGRGLWRLVVGAADLVVATWDPRLRTAAGILGHAALPVSL